MLYKDSTGEFTHRGGKVTWRLPCLMRTPKNPRFEMNIIGNKQSLTSGYLTQTYHDKVYPLCNVRISFIKDDMLTNPYQVVTESSLNTVVEITDTDMNGYYTACLENGDYIVRIGGGTSPKQVYRLHVDNGVNEYYKTYNYGLIQSRYEDILKFYGTDELYIHGLLLDEYRNPAINSTLIISQGTELFAYIKIKKDGKYGFFLPKGIYTVKVKGPRQSIQVFENIVLDDNQGFMNQLNLKYNLKIGNADET